MSVLDTLTSGVLAHSAKETQTLGEAFAKALPEASTLAFYGDLGVGKTTFIQGLARGLGIQKPITSPTFNLYNLYEGAHTLIHLDAYRLESPEAFEALLIEDFLVPPYCLAIEWPEKLGPYLPTDAWRLSLSIPKPGVHRIFLEK